MTPSKPPQPWTADEDVKLRALWAEGVSAAQIGLRIKRGKNSVISRAHRLHLPGRPSPIKQNSNAITKPKPERLRGNITPTQVYRLPKPAKTAVRLYMGPQEACQWMIDPEPCNETVVPGKPYCWGHCQRAYRKRLCEAA